MLKLTEYFEEPSFSETIVLWFIDKHNIAHGTIDNEAYLWDLKTGLCNNGSKPEGKFNLTPKQPKEYWKPIDGETAWYINYNALSIEKDTRWFDQTKDFDDNSQKLGLIFKTEKEAIAKLDREEAKQRLKEAIWKLNDCSFPEWDWSTSGHSKYSIELNRAQPEIIGNITYKNQPNWMYLSDVEKAKQLIESHKDDLILVLSE